MSTASQTRLQALRSTVAALMVAPASSDGPGRAGAPSSVARCVASASVVGPEVEVSAGRTAPAG